MADPQPFYRWAWVLEILGPATIRRATTDLPEAAAVATLGAFYMKGIKSIDSRIVEAMPSFFYGVRRKSGFQAIIYTEGDMDPTAEWRGSAFTLWHYDRERTVRTADMTGLVTDAQFANGQCTLQLDTVDAAILQQLLPAATINPKEGTPFEFAGTGGAGRPIPVIFGSDVLIQPPPISVNLTGDGELSTYDYALGFGDNILLSDAWAELDTARAGLERLHNWVNAPGTPTFLSGELDPHWKATRFSVTGTQSVRYTPDMPIRFKTTASAGRYRYSAVRAYHTTTTPHRVEIYDDSLSDGLSDVQIAGDFAVVRETYTTVTEGLLPVPAEEQAITALRLFGSEDSVTALVSNPTYPSGSGGTTPAQIIRAVITDPAWGMSTRVQQVVDSGTFDVATIAHLFAGLGGTIQAGIGYDGKQVPGEQVLDWLCMIGRCRLAKDALGRWTLAVDAQTSSVANFVFGPGLESGIRIKRVISYGRAPLDRAVRNVVLHWSPLGRAQARRVVLSPQGYARFSTKAVSGIGRDRHIYNPFIRDPNTAEKVLQYLAEMLKGEDEQLVFTAGPEAREFTVGQVIDAISTVDGFSGGWRIVETSKSLTDVQFTCIRNRDEAFAEPEGIEHSAEPSDDPDTRTAPGVGSNLIGNPEPAPPTNRSGAYVQFTDPGFAIVVGITPGSAIASPNGWEIAQSTNGGVIDELTMDASEAIRANTVSGHYVRMVWSAVSPDAPSASAQRADGIFADQLPIKSGRDYMLSFYGDADDGWAAVVYEYPTSPLVSSLLTLIRDDTDTDGNGWSRFYARWRPRDVTTRALVGICVTKPGTYQFAGVMLNAITGSARKPSEWRRDAFSPPVLHRFSQEIQLDGSTEYRVPLIQAGDYAVGATLRITDEFTFGTATRWSVGTDNDPEVWARNIRETFTVTTSANYKPGTVAAFFAEDSDIVVSFTKDDGEPGTATGGTFSILYSYTRSFPTPGP